MTTPALDTHEEEKRARGLLSLGLVLLGGLLLGLSFPNDIIPGRLGDHPPTLLGWIALLPLWWGIATSSGRNTRWAVWLYGLVFYLVTLSWMRLFGYLPWVLLALYLSVTPLLALIIAQRAARNRVALLPVTFALAWAGLEWLRGQGMFGFAWSEVGFSQVDGLTATIATLGGIPLITFLMLWVTGTLVFTLRKQTSRWLLPVSLAVLAVCLFAGWWGAARATARWQAHPNKLRVSVVQPNTTMGLTPQALVHMPSAGELARREQVLLDLSRQAINDARQGPDADLPRLVIWPESALPDSPYRASINKLRADTRTHFLIGAPEWVYEKNRNTFALRNSAFLLSADILRDGRYSKMHLVPFGEFVPFRALVARFYTVRSTDIIPGEERETLKLDGHTPGVGICFESTFAEIARHYAHQHASLLIYITNDAWFHQTSAGRQHFNCARFRALETGLPVARAASTGISGFIAPNGQILKEIPTYADGAATLTVPDGTPDTFNAHVGWLFGPLCLLVSVLLLLGSFLLRNSSSFRNGTSN